MCATIQCQPSHITHPVPAMSGSAGSLPCEAACSAPCIHIKKRVAATATADQAFTQASCSIRLVRTTSVTHLSEVNNHVTMLHRARLRNTCLLGAGSNQGPTEDTPMHGISTRAVVAASCTRVASHMVSRPAHFAEASVLWPTGSCLPLAVRNLSQSWQPSTSPPRCRASPVLQVVRSTFACRVSKGWKKPLEARGVTFNLISSSQLCCNS